MVRTARLELAHLSALPPQDSVSTNFTTSAVLFCLNCMRKPGGFGFPDSLAVYPESPYSPPGIRTKFRYLVGIWPAPEAAAAGAAGTGTLDGDGTVVPGICAAPDATGAGVGAVMPTLSSTLVPARGWALPKYASSSVQAKNRAANTPVVRDKKLALPLAPNRLPEPPLPKAAPISAPLPCCTRIKPIMASADSICMARTMVKTTFMLAPNLIAGCARIHWASAIIFKKSRALRAAPPIRPPSISGCASKVAALAAFMLPPYKILIRANWSVAALSCARRTA